MAPPDLRSQLEREEGLRRQRGMPEEARARVWSRVQSTVHGKRASVRRSPARLWIPVAGALAAGAVALVMWNAASPEAPGPRVVSGMELRTASKDLVLHEQDGTVAVEAGAATLVDEARGLAVETFGPLVFRTEPEGFRIVRGRAVFSVRPRAKGSPAVVVQVSAGAIEVMGTRFTVKEEEDGRGAVTLHEGAIRFREHGGREVLLHPGQSLNWPLPPVEGAPAEAPKVPATTGEPRRVREKPAAAEPVPAVEEVLREVEVLRSRREFEQAARHLQSALRQQPPATRELLSFELGSLLTYQLRDPERACAHWARHQRAFPRGRYAEPVARALASCDGGTPEDGR